MAEPRGVSEGSGKVVERQCSDVSKATTKRGSDVMQDFPGTILHSDSQMSLGQSPLKMSERTASVAESVTRSTPDRTRSGLSMDCRRLTEQVVAREDSDVRGESPPPEASVHSDEDEDSPPAPLMMHWVFVGQVTPRADEDDDCDTLRWKTRCEGTWTFSTGALHYLMFNSALFNYCMGHTYSAILSLVLAATLVCALLTARFLAGRGILAPDRAISAYAAVLMTAVLLEFVKSHICLGGGFHSSDILFGNMLAVPSALFHLRNRPVFWGTVLHTIRTVLCLVLLVFDDHLTAERPPRGIEQ
eukprot:2531388-Rhodomonas_salina.1